jgi:hypothetical protein
MTMSVLPSSSRPRRSRPAIPTRQHRHQRSIMRRKQGAQSSRAAVRERRCPHPPLRQVQQLRFRRHRLRPLSIHTTGRRVGRWRTLITASRSPRPPRRTGVVDRDDLLLRSDENSAVVRGHTVDPRSARSLSRRAMAEPRTEADPGYVLCYDCAGDGLCVPCSGTGILTKKRCPYCGSRKLCVPCQGVGQVRPRTFSGDKKRG